jgi:hypothetical protein
MELEKGKCPAPAPFKFPISPKEKKNPKTEKQSWVLGSGLTNTWDLIIRPQNSPPPLTVTWLGLLYNMNTTEKKNQPLHISYKGHTGNGSSDTYSYSKHLTPSHTNLKTGLFSIAPFNQDVKSGF